MRKNPGWSIVKFSLIAVALLAASSALAQVTPGQVQDTLKQLPQRTPPLETPQSPPAIEKPAQPQAPEAAASQTVRVKSFEFTGNTVFTKAQLQALVAGYLNQEITLLDIYAAADAVTNYYVANGYSLAFVNVPPQKVTDGTVKLEVNEGVIGKIKIEGNRRVRSERILRHLGEIKSGQIYRGMEVEQGIKRLNELPGLSVRAVAAPGETYGLTDLTLNARETRLSGALFADNYGNESTGQHRFIGSLTLNHLANVEDQLNLLALTTSGNRLNYGFIAYGLPVDFTGTRLNASYSHAEFEVPDSAEGDNKNARIWLAQPLIREKNDRLDLSVGISRTDSSAFVAASDILLSGTSITLVEAGATYNHRYTNAAVTQVTTSLATNFEKTGSAAEARPALVKAEDSKQRLRLELDVLHLQPLGSGFFVSLHGNGGYSPDPLPNTSQYSIGGPQSIRGFPASEIRGDRGYFAQVDLGRRFDTGAMTITPRIFADSGKVSCAEAAPDCASNTLTSAGVGSDFQYRQFTAKVDYSEPLDSHAASDGDDSGRVYGSIFMSF